MRSLTIGFLKVKNKMDLTPTEKSIIELIRRTKYGSIEIHFKDKEIIWIDKHRRYSPEALTSEFDKGEVLV